MILGSLLASVFTGLLTTMDAKTAAWKLISYQGLLGRGTGIRFQRPEVAVQAILNDEDAQIGIAIFQFAQALGPAVAVATAQAIFSSGLASPSQGVAAGQDLANISGEASYDDALTWIFYLPATLRRDPWIPRGVAHQSQIHHLAPLSEQEIHRGFIGTVRINRAVPRHCTEIKLLLRDGC
ncbi:hypothetical protein QBC44DRAFT_150928 [Cladorrhinum sp. PSN332]|nr:hypothetical protein QBC44DRAFT_150928 [Cladorrhinum sp. PSN332]